MTFRTHGEGRPSPALSGLNLDSAVEQPETLLRAPSSRKIRTADSGPVSMQPLRSPSSGRRIALFTGNFVTVTDGVSRTLGRLVTFLESRGDQLHVFAPDGPLPAGRDRAFTALPSLPVPGRPEYRFSLGLPRRARRRLDRFAPDLVHVATPDLLGIAAMTWANARGVPLVATYHTHFPTYLRYYHFAWMERPLYAYLKWFYGRCVHLYVPTTETASDLNRHGIVEPIRLWSRGVDCERFHPSCRSAAWRSRHGFAPDDVVVSYVGRLVREKGLDVAASVIERLHRDGSNVRSLIVGDGPLRESLRKRLTETIFTGHLDGDALSTAYASSDIFLFPSDSEAFGNVIVEAMASGLPVVCAAGTGAGSHVADGRTGLVAPPRDADAFYDRTRRLVRDRALRETMGRRARAAAASYDWSQTLQNISNYYDEAIATMALRR